MQQLIKRRMAAPGKKNGNNNKPQPKNHPSSLLRFKGTGFAKKSLQYRPQAHNKNEHARVDAIARMARKTLFGFHLHPAGLLADRAPVLAAILRIHPITEEARHGHPQGFSLGQTPLRGEVPLPFLGLLLLLRHGCLALGAH